MTLSFVSIALAITRRLVYNLQYLGSLQTSDRHFTRTKGIWVGERTCSLKEPVQVLPVACRQTLNFLRWCMRTIVPVATLEFPKNHPQLCWPFCQKLKWQIEEVKSRKQCCVVGTRCPMKLAWGKRASAKRVFGKELPNETT